jgi:hypothetical protein
MAFMGYLILSATEMDKMIERYTQYPPPPLILKQNLRGKTFKALTV